MYTLEHEHSQMWLHEMDTCQFICVSVYMRVSLYACQFICVSVYMRVSLYGIKYISLYQWILYFYDKWYTVNIYKLCYYYCI